MSTVHDMTNWLRNPNWRTSHLEGTTQSGSKVVQYCYDTGRTLAYIKTANGWPMDLKAYDQNFIHDTTTELGWTDPHDYVQNGWPMMPRWWDDAQQGQVIYNAVSHPVHHMNCAAQAPGDVSPTTYALYGPAMYDFGGTIGTLACVQLHYFWSRINQEKLFLCKEHGWVLWEYWVNVAGVWTKKQFSNHNNVVQGGSMKPVFPCYTIP